MDINWEDFDFEDFNNDGIWNSNHTGNYYNPDDYSNSISSIDEKSEEEKEYEAFNNTYKMLLGGEKVVNGAYIFDPEEYRTRDNIFFDKNKLIDKIINYFCELEEYEKCAKLLKLKK